MASSNNKTLLDARYRARNRIALRKSQSEYRLAHPDRLKKAQALFKQRHPQYRQEHHLKTAFGLSLEQYQQMVKNQAGMCLICSRSPNGRAKKLVVDHDHKTQKTRGLLCDSCNRGLGLFCDSPESLERARSYILGLPINATEQRL